MNHATDTCSRKEFSPTIIQGAHSITDPKKDSIAVPLTFPAFHTEMLTQGHWNAGDNFGRIKVLVAAGIVHGQGCAFERSRCFVCFAFQHAPLRKYLSAPLRH